LAKGAFGPLWANGFDRVPDALDVSHQTVGHHWKSIRKNTIIVDQKNVAEISGGVASNKLRDDLGANWTPYVIDPISFTNRLSIVDRLGAVSICKYKYV